MTNSASLRVIWQGVIQQVGGVKWKPTVSSRLYKDSREKRCWLLRFSFARMRFRQSWRNPAALRDRRYRCSAPAARLHMPPSVIGKIAANAHVKRLILSHRMLRTLGKENETQAEINRSFSGPVAFANDLDCFPVQ